MGRLTDDMTRLNSEIGFLRVKRNEALVDVRKFVNGLKQNVSDSQADMHASRERTAKEMKSNLTDFVVNLKTTVNGLQHEVAEDLAEIRDIWSGTSTQPRKKAASHTVKSPRKPVRASKAAAKAPGNGKSKMGMKNSQSVAKKMSKPALKSKKAN